MSEESAAPEPTDEASEAEAPEAAGDETSSPLGPAPAGPYDLDRLRELFELMKTYDLGEVALKDGSTQVRLRRGGVSAAPLAPAVPAAPVEPVPQAPAAPAAPAAPSAPAASADDAGAVIKSPTVGTFYASPSPDDPPFVKIGSKVEPDTTVCLVEAMKVFNQIPAEVKGTITEVLVASGDAVDFGQPLYKVELS
ncbi:MAG: acetyl-CoA carboxylase biotin carboxyl carrier protein [Planctomycetota bacterium]